MVIFSIIFVTAIWMLVSIARGGHKGVGESRTGDSSYDPRGHYYDIQNDYNDNRRGRCTGYYEGDR